MNHYTFQVASGRWAGLTRCFITNRGVRTAQSWIKTMGISDHTYREMKFLGVGDPGTYGAIGVRIPDDWHPLR